MLEKRHSRHFRRWLANVIIDFPSFPITGFYLPVMGNDEQVQTMLYYNNAKGNNPDIDNLNNDVCFTD